jgi:hypothetical protein
MMTLPLRSLFGSCLRVFLFAVLCLTSSILLQAQQDNPRLSQLEKHIQSEVAALNDASLITMSGPQKAYRWAMLGSDYADAADFSHAESAYVHAVELLKDDPSARVFYAAVLEKFGYLYLTYGRLPEALNCRRTALDVRQQIGEPLAIARSRSHLAEVLLTMRRYGQAEKEAAAAYQSMIELDDSEKTDLVSVLVVLAYTRCARHSCSQGLADARQAVAISRVAFQPDSMPMGAALMVQGYAESKTGDISNAEDTTRRALAILKVQLAPGDPRLIHALQQYHDCLESRHKKQEAIEVDEQLASMNQRSKQTCFNCMISVYAMRSNTH